MEGSRGPGEDGPRSLGVEWCASWSGVAQQHYYPAMSLFWGVVDFRYLPWLVSGSSFGAGTGERKGSASDQTEMTAMHLFLPPPPPLLLFTQGAYHGHPFQTGMDWDSGCRVHVETENMTLLFGTSLVILTRDASVKVQYGPSQYREDGSCCCVYCATFATNLVLALGRPVQSRIKTK